MRILLNQRMPKEGIEVLVLLAKAARVLGLVGLHLLEAGQNHRLVALLVAARPVHRAGYEAQVLRREAGVQRLGDLDDGMLSHAVANEVRPRV